MFCFLLLGTYRVALFLLVEILVIRYKFHFPPSDETRAPHFLHFFIKFLITEFNRVRKINSISFSTFLKNDSTPWTFLNVEVCIIYFSHSQ